VPKSKPEPPATSRKPARAVTAREQTETAGERKLERLRRAVLIAELVKQSGVALEAQGPLRLGACPYHDDKGASLVLNTKTNTWRCEPCKAGGDVIAWVQKRDALDFIDALDVIKGMVARGEAAEPTEATPAPTERAGVPAISSSLAAELAAPERKGPWSRRIPEDEVERLKRDVSIVRLVEAEGVKLSGHGDNRIGLCPLHDDKNPSLVVSPKKNVWHCLGACQAGGSVIDWVMRTERGTVAGLQLADRAKQPDLAKFVSYMQHRMSRHPEDYLLETNPKPELDHHL